MNTYIEVRIVFKNGQQYVRNIKSFADIEEAVKTIGYNMSMVRTIHFGG